MFKLISVIAMAAASLPDDSVPFLAQENVFDKFDVEHQNDLFFHDKPPIAKFVDPKKTEHNNHK